MSVLCRIIKEPLNLTEHRVNLKSACCASAKMWVDSKMLLSESTLLACNCNAFKFVIALGHQVILSSLIEHLEKASQHFSVSQHQLIASDVAFSFQLYAVIWYSLKRDVIMIKRKSSRGSDQMIARVKH